MFIPTKEIIVELNQQTDFLKPGRAIKVTEEEIKQLIEQRIWKY